jgi:hypothetical protein
MEAPIISPNKEFQGNAKEGHSNVLWDQGFAWLWWCCKYWVVLWYIREGTAGLSLQKTWVIMPQHHHFVPFCELALWLVMELTLRGDGPPSLQSPFDVQCFRLFGSHKHLAGKQFAGDTNVKRSGMCWIWALDTDVCARMKPKCTQKVKCHEWWWWLEVHCVPSATHVPCVHR